MSNLKYITILSSSHWDREWFRDFRTYQFRLKKVMDDVLDTLENNPEFSLFITDGQTAMLEDYLEAAPDNKIRTQHLLDTGRILTGPFYTMPDENLVTGESLIANLRLGHQITEHYADHSPWKMGYLCDMFGHVAQMPQILKGFDIFNAILGRGTNQHETPAYFRWQSPDGSEVITFKLPESCSYGSFWLDLYSDVVHGEDNASQKTLTAAIESSEREAHRVNLPYLILMDGVDHEPIHHSLPEVAKTLSAHFGCPVSIGGVDTVFTMLANHWNDLPVMAGELQQPARKAANGNGGSHALISGTLSSRVDIKQCNDALSNLLEKNAAAASSLALMYQIPAADALLAKAKKLWLQSHAHDSICGCSIGSVNRAILSRCAEASSIAENYTGYLFAELCGGKTYNGSKEQKIVIFNALPYEVKGLQKLNLFFPSGYAFTQTEQIPDEPVNSFRLFGEQGEIPFQILGVRKNAVCRFNGNAYPESGDRYTILADLCLPPMGTYTLDITPSEKPVRPVGSLRTAPLCIENNFLRLTVESNGAVTLLDKLTNKHYYDLLNFTHEGETGDSWYHRKPVGGAESHAHFAGANVLYDGPVACGISIRYLLHVPKFLVYGRNEVTPSEVFTEVTISIRLTLGASEDFLRMEVELDNRAEDGKITMSLPCDATQWFAETPFAFVQRNSGWNIDTHDWFETDRVGKSFSGVAYDKDGLAFISGSGLHECGVNTTTRRMEIALLRSFRKNFLTDGEPDGQLIGKHKYSAWIMPTGNRSNGDLIRMREMLQTPLVYDTFNADGLQSGTKKLGVAIDARNIVASTICRSGNKLLIRLVNYGCESEAAVVQIPRKIREVWLANLLEQPKCKLPHSCGAFKIDLKPYQIQTILVSLE